MDSPFSPQARDTTSQVVLTAVQRYAARIRSPITREDIESAAWRAYDAFFLAKHDNLRTHEVEALLYTCVSRAIVDEIRKGMPTSTLSQRRRTRCIRAAWELGVAEENIGQHLLRVAAAAGLSPLQAKHALEEGRAADTSPIDEHAFHLQDPSVALTEVVARGDDHRCLDEAISRLPPRERRVVMGVFFEERRIQDLAAELRVAPSRIYQIRDEALMRLRNQPNLRELATCCAVDS